MNPELTVIIPTRDRAATLIENLGRLAREGLGESAEVVVVDDGSVDETPEALERAAELPLELRVVRREGAGGPGAARNQGIELARGSACLFLGDDTLAAPGLVARHLEFHRRSPDAESGLLGLIVPAPSAASPFAEWLHEAGKQFAFASIAPGRPIPAELFNTANASVKRELLQRAGGFDERFGVGNDDVELGLRLGHAGLRLSYDPEAVAEHDHPTDLQATLRRMRANGRSYRLLTDLHDDQPRPRRPAARHRAKAAALTVTAVTLPRRRATRERVWAFLCEEAHREGFWGEPDPVTSQVRIGRLLARIAARDPGVRSAAAPAAKAHL